MGRDQMRGFLGGVSPLYIRPGDSLTKEDLDWLGSPVFDFERTEVLFSLALEEGGHLRVERPCLKCGVVESVEWSPAHTLAFLRAYRRFKWAPYLLAHILAKMPDKRPDFFCKDCRYEVFPSLEADTKFFIRNFLCQTSERNCPSEHWTNMKELYGISDKDAIAEYIREMDYDTFLATLYWKLVSNHVKEAVGFSCQLCGKKDIALHCHHRSYEHHGYEVEFWREDLICLCEDCHKKFHDELPNREAVSASQDSWKGFAVLDQIMKLLQAFDSMSAKEVASALRCKPSDLGWAFGWLKKKGLAYKEDGKWRLKPLSARIVDFLAKNGPCSLKDIAEELDVPCENVRWALSRLREAGEVIRLPDGRRWASREEIPF